jgi:hypothetical protein
MAQYAILVCSGHSWVQVIKSAYGQTAALRSLTGTASRSSNGSASATIAAVIAAIVAAVAGAAVAWASATQLILARRTATLNAIQPFYTRYHSPAARELRREIYRGEIEFSTITPEKRQQIEDLINSLEFLGALVNNKLISFRVVKSIFHTSVSGLYPPLTPYIMQQRQQGPTRKNYALNYEKLAKRYP